MTDDPFKLFLAWYGEAQNDPDYPAETAALATSTRDGRPSVRFLYFRGIREGGFSFFTNYDSRKGDELSGNPFASMAFYWPRIGKQVRIEGAVERLSSNESDSYWQARPRESQVSATASHQSQPLLHEAAYLAEMDYLEHSTSALIPRPANWGGFKIVPSAFEFWTRGEHRRHQRVRYEIAGETWRSTLLYP
jgi:pyridoxamine 5'-phosphate oxidase